jgi:hypothetical protein
MNPARQRIVEADQHDSRGPGLGGQIHRLEPAIPARPDFSEAIERHRPARGGDLHAFQAEPIGVPDRLGDLQAGESPRPFVIRPEQAVRRVKGIRPRGQPIRRIDRYPNGKGSALIFGGLPRRFDVGVGG